VVSSRFVPHSGAPSMYAAQVHLNVCPTKLTAPVMSGGQAKEEVPEGEAVLVADPAPRDTELTVKTRTAPVTVELETPLRLPPEYVDPEPVERESVTVNGPAGALLAANAPAEHGFDVSGNAAKTVADDRR